MFFIAVSTDVGTDIFIGISLMFIVGAHSGFEPYCYRTVKARRGSGFYEIFCIFANMSCLCIHLVTLFNLPGKKKIVMEFFFLCRKISFFHHPKMFISVK